jgi:hypothetical protein
MTVSIAFGELTAVVTVWSAYGAVALVHYCYYC